MSLAAAIRDAEREAGALRSEIHHAERAIARHLAEAARADENVEQWWFGRRRLRRLYVSVRAILLKTHD